MRRPAISVLHRDPSGSTLHCVLCVAEDGVIDTKSLWKPSVPCSLRVNGRCVSSTATVIELSDQDFQAGFISVEHVPLLLGGKGGFGTLLRGKGARRPRTTNFDSARDLSGRRLRVVEAPKKLKKWKEKKIRDEKILLAIGGADPYLGKKLSSQEVVNKYQIQVSHDSFNPFQPTEPSNSSDLANCPSGLIGGAAQAIKHIGRMKMSAQQGPLLVDIDVDGDM